MHDRWDRRYLKRSLGLSIGLHPLVLPVLIALFWSAEWGIEPSAGAAFEGREATVVSYLRIERRPPPRRAAARAPSAPAPAPRRVVALLKRPEIAHRARVHTAGRPVTIALAAAPARAAKPIVVIAVFATASAPARAGSASADRRPANAAPGTLVVAATPTPVPTATATPISVADDRSAHGADLPPGGWGQTFEHPLVADDAALDDLRARFHAAANASIEVDETGNPLRVMLPDGLAEDVRADLQRALMDLRYVPAECNGLRCSGTLDLTL
jgi:hypothetical protein